MGERRHLRTKMVLPVRITGLDRSGKPFSILGHTLNFSRGGARLGGTEVPLEVGQMITVEYKRQKCKYVVRWIGQSKPTMGQVGIESLEPERYIWIETHEQQYRDDIDPNRFRSQDSPSAPPLSRPNPANPPAIAPPPSVPAARVTSAVQSGPAKAQPQLSHDAAEHAVPDLERVIRSSNLSREAALQSIAENACSWLHATGAAIALYEGTDMVCRATSGLAPALGLRFQPTEGLTGEAVRTHRPVVCHDTANDPRVDPQLWTSISIRSVASIPILAGNMPAGVLEVFAASPNVFTHRESLLLEQLATLAARLLVEAREKTHSGARS